MGLTVEREEGWETILSATGPVLVTGVAGFIGYHVAERLLQEGVEVVGCDNLNDYYDPALKKARLARLRRHERFSFSKVDIADLEAIEAIFDAHRPAHVVHLAAQAGVRYSLTHPHAYGEANLAGFLNILEACRGGGVNHLVYASSSSVYGGNAVLPYSTSQSVDHPVSLYAATKKANELMAHVYSHLYGLPTTGLRFFTVYGPWGRPDMAYWKFTEAISEGRPIEVYNNGEMGRDFTYIDDVVDAVVRVAAIPATPDPDFDPADPDTSTSWAPYRVYNLGARRPERLLDMIAILEQHIGRKAEKVLLPIQPGDVRETWADMGPLNDLLGERESIPIREGLEKFVGWWREWRGR